MKWAQIAADVNMLIVEKFLPVVKNCISWVRWFKTNWFLYDLL